MKTGYIYRYWLNDKSYIGQTVNLKNTRYRHKEATTETKFYKAIKKHGYKKFQFEILESNIPREQLNSREIYWIKKFDSHKNGYNSTPGGALWPEQGQEHPNTGKTPWNKNKPRTQETKERISKTLKDRRISGENNPFYGKNHTEQTKESISKANKNNIPWNKGKTGIYSKEHREIISKTHKNKKLTNEQKKAISKKTKGKNNPFHNKKHSQQTKQIISNKHKGRTPWNKGKQQHKKSSSLQLKLF